jgi:hypothetical protein
VTAYAVQRPDGEWSVMMVNKDQHAAHKVELAFEKDGSRVSFRGPVHEAVFGSEQYHWSPAQASFNAHPPLADENAGHLYSGGDANPDGPITERDVTGAGDTQYELPPASIVVLRGSLAAR